jgi:hypothetical protein
LTLRLPGDLPPRTYHLTAQVVDRHKGQALPTATGETLISLGSLKGQLAKTPRLIDPARLPNPTMFSPGEGPGREIVLRGYAVEDTTVQPGQSIDLTLHWQVLQPPAQNYRLEFFLVNEQVETIYPWSAVEPINGEWPTHQWPVNYWVQDRLSLPIGADTPPGQFTLYVAWVAGSTEPSDPVEAEAFELGRIIVTE